MNRIKKLLAFCLSLTMICGAALSVNAANSVGLVTVRTDFSEVSVPAAVPVLQYAGSGNSSILNTALPKGTAYKVTFTYGGKGNFIINFITDERTELLVNSIGSYAGTTLLSDGSDAVPLGIFDIRAEGNWTITVSTVTNLSTNSVTSIGDKVSGVFNLPGTGTTVSINNTGKGNFIVWAHYSDGTSQLLVNNIGAYSGQAVLNNPKKTNCYLEVKSDGQWTVDMGYGGALSLVPDIN